LAWRRYQISGGGFGIQTQRHSTHWNAPSSRSKRSQRAPGASQDGHGGAVRAGVLDGVWSGNGICRFSRRRLDALALNLE
jgi:hypothetical protein